MALLLSGLFYGMSGCSFTNLFLWDEGNEGDRTTLPVSLDHSLRWVNILNSFIQKKEYLLKVL